MFRIILIIAAGVAFYWLYTKRKQGAEGELTVDLSWQAVFKEELPALKQAVPMGQYINLLALSRSKISREDCIERLDEIIAGMKDEGLATQAVATLVLKLEHEGNIH